MEVISIRCSCPTSNATSGTLGSVALVYRNAMFRCHVRTDKFKTIELRSGLESGKFELWVCMQFGYIAINKSDSQGVILLLQMCCLDLTLPAKFNQ